MGAPLLQRLTQIRLPPKTRSSIKRSTRHVLNPSVRLSFRPDLCGGGMTGYQGSTGPTGPSSRCCRSCAAWITCQRGNIWGEVADVTGGRRRDEIICWQGISFIPGQPSPHHPLRQALFCPNLGDALPSSFNSHQVLGSRKILWGFLGSF